MTGEQEVTVASRLTGEEFPKNKWTHAAGVADYEKRKSRLYINGLLESTNELMDFEMPEPPEFKLMIGKSPPDRAGPMYYDSGIRKFSLWNRVLTESEISALSE